jgi:outer membrane protein insertion porin family
VSRYDENSVDVYLKIEEGNKYYLRNVNWVGNSVFSTAALSEALQLKAGDVYNQKLLDERLMTDETSIHKEYYNKGYVWSRPVPVELSVENDSIDLEIRITEGPQATINKVTIAGNDRLYEEVVRREL